MWKQQANSPILSVQKGKNNEWTGTRLVSYIHISNMRLYRISLNTKYLLFCRTKVNVAGVLGDDMIWCAVVAAGDALDGDYENRRVHSKFSCWSQEVTKTCRKYEW